MEILDAATEIIYDPHGFFVRVANMTGGGLGCPASDVNPRHLDEMPPSTRTRWKFPGDGSSP